MINALLNVFSGCGHRHTTFPLTAGRKLGVSSAPATLNRTYVVCLDCGKEFQYDWNQMRMGQPIGARRQAVPAERTEKAASLVHPKLVNT